MDKGELRERAQAKKIPRDDNPATPPPPPGNASLYAATQRAAVQQASTATLPTSTDLMQPTQRHHLRQRPASTSVLLVHTEVLATKRDADQGHIEGT